MRFWNSLPGGYEGLCTRRCTPMRDDQVDFVAFATFLTFVQ